jgi:hypothetical protein
MDRTTRVDLNHGEKGLSNAMTTPTPGPWYVAQLHGEDGMEHYTRIGPDEFVHKHPDCGCRLERDGDVSSVSLYHCPTHAAAPEMLAALKLIAGLPRGHDITRARMEATKALRAVEG